MDLKSKNFMDDNEDFNKSTYWVLSELKEESFVLENKDQEIEFCFDNRKNSPDKKVQDRVIRFLEKEKAISLTAFYTTAKMLKNVTRNLDLYGHNPAGYDVKLLRPRFDELYKEYLAFKPSKNNNDQYQFNLTIYHDRGTFFVDEKRKIEFRNLIRPLILEVLYKAKGKDVSSDKIKTGLKKKLLNDGEIEKLSSVIDDIRKKIKDNLKIDPKIVIPDGISGSGYRIGDIEINITRE
jgi:hypothetical protein